MIQIFNRSHRKMYLIVIAILLVAAIVWAAVELSGQANQKSLEAAAGSAEMEMVTLDTLKSPKKEKAPNCNWQKEKEFRHEIKANDEEYKKLIQVAKAEVTEQTSVSDDTKAKVLESAEGYSTLQTQYAEMWESCNCKTRANLATKLAASRLKNAEVVTSEIDEAKLKEMEKAQEEVRQARREYVKQAKENDELTVEDKRDIQVNVIPQTDKMLAEFQTLASSVFSLLKEVQSTATKATSGGASGLFGAAKKLIGGGGPSLLTRVKTLVTVTKNMITNAQALQADATTLTE